MEYREIHERYLEQFNNKASKATAKSLLRELEKHEMETGVSYFAMDRDSMLAWLNKKMYTVPLSIRNVIYGLRRYGDWAVAESYRTDNPAYDIQVADVDMIDAYRQKFFDSYPGIYSLIGNVGEPSEGLAVFPISVFAWMGVDIQEAALLPEDAVDLTGQTIHCKSKLTSRKMTDFMCDVLREYQKCREIKRDNGISYYPYRCGRFMYRMAIVNFEDDHVKNQPVNITSELGKTAEYLQRRRINRSVSYVDWQRSGQLNKLYRMEKSGVDFSDKMGKEFVRNTLNAPKAYPADGMLMYNAYKKAFNLD